MLWERKKNEKSFLPQVRAERICDFLRIWVGYKK